MEGPTVVSTVAADGNCKPNQTTRVLSDASTTTAGSKPAPGRLGHRWKTKGISAEASNLIANSWRSSTKLQYESAWKSWTSWCSGQQVNPLSPTVADLVNFLAKAHSNEKSYSTLNTYRSALSSALPRIEGHVAGQHPLIVRLMRGVFNTTPPKPRYSKTWKVSIVLDYLKSLPVNNELSLLVLSQKLLTRHLNISVNSCVISVLDLLKTNCPKRGLGHNKIVIPKFDENPKLCVLRTLNDYLDRTESLRTVSEETKLFISTKKPHKKVTTGTLARWMKAVLCAAGIDPSVYTAHSFRSAATSAAFAHGVKLQEIL